MVQYKPSAQEILDRKSYGHGSRARFDPQWAMSRPTNWYTQSYDTGKSKIRNIDLIKDTLVRQPAVTTDQNESRNMYQMLMNQIKGGGGAQLIDTSGIPAGARRIGRTLFTNPAKSQGFFGDVGSLFTGKNKAAVRAPVHNVFGNFGQKGKDWYKKEFPLTSALSGIMSAAENFIPPASWLNKLLPKRKKEIIPRNPMFSPANNPWGPAWELLEDEIVNDDFNWMDAHLENSQIPPQFNIQKLRDEGREGKFNLEDNIPTDVEEVLDVEIKPKQKPPFLEDDILTEEDKFNEQYSFVNEMDHFDSPYDYIMEFKARNENLDIDAIIQNAILQGIIIENNV